MVIGSTDYVSAEFSSLIFVSSYKSFLDLCVSCDNLLMSFKTSTRTKLFTCTISFHWFRGLLFAIDTEDLTLVVIVCEIYETSLRLVS